MVYNFDEIIDRSKNQSIKWEFIEELFGSKDVVPMWVADMDFKTAEPIIEALRDRVEEGIFGYTALVNSYYESFVDWCKNRHDWLIEKNELIYSPGVVPALIYSVQALTEVGDGIVIQSPVYGPFARSIKDHNRQVILNPLIEEDGYYTMNYDELDQLFTNGAKGLILCNPHNPIGRVWSEEELVKLKDIVKKHNVFVISDEIHSDLIMKGYKHIPLAKFDDIRENVITCMAPSKTFNLAGLQAAIVHTHNPEYFKLLSEAYEKMDMKINNCFGQIAFEAAYKKGLPWLEEVLMYIENNMDFAIDYINEHIQEIKVRKPEGTYLLWLDCRNLGMNHETLKKFMAEKAKVGMTDGAFFGEEGNGFMRLNLATPKKNVEEALKRIAAAVHQLRM